MAAAGVRSWHLRHSAAMSTHRIVLCAAAVALASACTGYAPGNLAAGHGTDEVTRQLGAPTGRHALPKGGTRLEFARGPFGRHTYMVDVDAQGRVMRWQQVLNEAQFGAIIAGMTQDELLFRLGRPSHTRGGGWQPGEVWSYRYDAIFCQWFQVSVVGGRVRDTSYGPDPLCEVGKVEDRPI
jgi:hypothetical protein